MNFPGTDRVGVAPENGRKLLSSVMFVAALLITSRALRPLAGLLLGRTDTAGIQTRFRTRQAVSLPTARAAARRRRAAIPGAPPCRDGSRPVPETTRDRGARKRRRRHQAA